jgi:hypothetical protein
MNLWQAYCSGISLARPKKTVITSQQLVLGQRLELRTSAYETGLLPT